MKIKRLLISSVLLTSLLTSCGGQGHRHKTEEYKAGEIVVNADNGFKILQLCDINLSNKDNQELQLDFLSLTLNDAKNKGVDLVVLDGDTFTFADKATAIKLFDFINSFGMHWTFTFGNHDEQCYFSVTWLTSYLNEYGKLCIFKDIQDDDVTGHANFYIDIKNGTNLFERVFIFDSNRYYFSDYMGYDYIKQDQIDWYQRMVQETEFCESLAFFHIPVPEFANAWQAYKNNDPSVEYMGGDMKESDVSSPKYNSGLFDKMVELNSTKGIFCAHDHENDFAIKYKGIVLSYGTNSTDRIYSNEEMMGGQIITLDKEHNMSFERINHKYSEVEGK